MNKVKLLLIAALALLGTSAFAQKTLSEAVAPGNKVQVATPEEADFIMQVVAKQRIVFNSPRTWLTPSVLSTSGHVFWEAKTQQADATMFNGFKATNTCIKKVVEKSFREDLFPKAGRQ